MDGSKGAQLNPGNGIILQLMDDDDPGPGHAGHDQHRCLHTTRPGTAKPDTTHVIYAPNPEADAVATLLQHHAEG